MIKTAERPGDRTRQFQTTGVALIEYALSVADLAGMDAAFPVLSPGAAGARASDFSPTALHKLSTHDGLLELASLLAGARLRVCRVLGFDKSSGTNWFVPWHQDRAADGNERTVAVLEGMVALRIHLDDCDENNGPLEVIPGSHTLGRLDRAALAQVVARQPPLTCLAARGDIVALRPLLVHRSQRARRPRVRRVLHIEFKLLGGARAKRSVL